MIAVTHLEYVSPAMAAAAPKVYKKKERVAGKHKRQEKNIKFANDGSLESVQELLYKIAAKCHARVEALGISMNFDDVMQEMYVSYVKSKQKWNPEGEALFNTYCTTVCLNNFNHAIAKMVRERAMLLIGSEGDFTSKQDDGGGDKTPFMESQPAPLSDDPAFRIESAQETSRRMATLSLSAKKLVAILLSAERDPQGESVTLRAAAKQANLEGAELRRTKLEIFKTYGVTWH